MSLTREQQISTINEFADNMARLGATNEQVAAALGGTPEYAGRVARLEARNLEDPWVLKNYLLARAREQGIEPRPFTALGGDYHGYWFLDSDYIDRGRFA